MTKTKRKNTGEKHTRVVKRITLIDKRKKSGGARPGAGKPKGSGTLVPLDVKAAFGVKCREYSQEALEFIVGVMRAEEDGPYAAVRDDFRLRIDQAQLLIAYGFGRPAQSHEVHGTMQAMIGIKIDWERFDALPTTEKKLIMGVLEHVAAGSGQPSGGVGAHVIEHRAGREPRGT